MRPAPYSPCRQTGLHVAALVVVALSTLYAKPARAQYQILNLVSDLPRSQQWAIFHDTNLVNPWGIAFSPTGPIWVNDNGTGLATVYRAFGQPFPNRASKLIVTIPPPAGGSGPAAPTGMVFNGTTDFVISEGSNSGPAFFIFDTEDGTISGWNPAADSANALLQVDNSQPGGPDGLELGAIYKGLAIGNNGSGNFIYAANFRDGVVEMYDSSFHFVKFFTDPNIVPDAEETGFAPFGISAINGQLYVTFAQQNSERHDDLGVDGFIDVFDFNGNFVKQLVAAGGGVLNSPWGLALAPNNFGEFSNDLIVGNFGDGHISAFDPNSGAFIGQLTNVRGGGLIQIDGLWGLAFGNGHSGQRTNVLYFTAGINDEADGLFGRIHPVHPNR
jgi:uncharacterized protein (TIGR03118 family)